MRAYRLRDTPDEPGIPLTRIEPRALLVPPGFPDFMTRRRVLRSGAVQIEGRAWSGWAPVSMVEVSIDGGDTWEPADVQATQGRHGWARWTWTWDSAPGSYVLSCRATDASGRTHPTGPCHCPRFRSVIPTILGPRRQTIGRAVLFTFS
jgi:sulfane dehydrogenase subunit SoxC